MISAADAQDARVSARAEPTVLFRDGVLLEFESGLNAGVAPAPGRPTAGAMLLRAQVRLEVEHGLWAGVLELESRTRGSGRLVGVGRDTGDDGEAGLGQAFVRARLGDWTAYLGVRDLRAVTRFWGEPFFLDVTESEPAFARLIDSGQALRNLVYRDATEPVGALIRYDPMGALRVEAFAYRVFDTLWGPAGAGGDRISEDLFGVYIDLILHPEDLKGFVVLTDFRGGGDPSRPKSFNRGVDSGSDVYTAGGGFDLFLGEDKLVEVFAEGYRQFGRLARGVDKDGYAVRVGVRAVIERVEHSWFGELSAWEVSGDADPFDDEDGTFQSYENEDALAILQSNNYGLDIDANYRGAALSAGARGLCGFDIWIEAGTAAFVHRPRNDAGARFAPRGLGYEIDLEVRWPCAQGVQLSMTAALLFDSPAMDALAGRREAWLVALGGAFKF
jgi:hypothetical protein